MGDSTRRNAEGKTDVDCQVENVAHKGNLTHLDAEGKARMVDVGDKPVSRRVAVASARVLMQAETARQIEGVQLVKGDALNAARLAGIMAAKRTSELIPLCHQVPLDDVQVAFQFLSDRQLGITATVTCHARTGVEMEALVAVTHAALTVYDMCKAVDREMVIEQVQLESKQGGRGGDFVRSTP